MNQQKNKQMKILSHENFLLYSAEEGDPDTDMHSTYELDMRQHSTLSDP